MNFKVLLENQVFLLSPLDYDERCLWAGSLNIHFTTGIPSCKAKRYLKPLGASVPKRGTQVRSGEQSLNSDYSVLFS